MNTKEFQRESISRHHSERMLDRQIMNFEKKHIMENYDEEIQKKIKKDEEEKKAKQEKINMLRSLEIKPHQALNKALSHLKNKTKQLKVLELIKKTLTGSWKEIKRDHIFYTIYQIMMLYGDIEDIDARKQILQIFEFVKENKILEEDAEQKEIFEAWCLAGIANNQLFTDDSFAFTAALKKIKVIIDGLYESSFVDITDAIEEDKRKEIEAREALRNKLLKENEREQLLEKYPHLRIELEEKERESQQSTNKNDGVNSKRSRDDEENRNSNEPEPTSALSRIKQKLAQKKQEKIEKVEEVNEQAVENIKKQEEEEKEEASQSYEFTLPEEVLNYMNVPNLFNIIKQRVLYEVSRDCMRLYTNGWAKAPIKQYFDELYLKRDLFAEELKTKFEDLKAAFQNNAISDINANFKRDYLDSKISSNPLSSQVQVKDGRSTSLSFGGGLDTWGARQVGL